MGLRSLPNIAERKWRERVEFWREWLQASTYDQSEMLKRIADDLLMCVEAASHESEARECVVGVLMRQLSAFADAVIELEDQLNATTRR